MNGSNKFICTVCEYETDRKSDIERHEKTRKHNGNVKRSKKKIKNNGIKNNGVKNKKTSDSITCKYCGKSICRKTNLKRHYKSCKKIDVQNVEKIEFDLLKTEFETLKLKMDNELFLRETMMNEQNIRMTELEQEILSLKEEINKVKKEKNTRIIVSKKMKDIVWDKFVGIDYGRAYCYSCGSKIIRQSDFHVGHIQSVENNGKTILKNLLPICRRCNQSMGTTNMHTFMIDNGFEINDKCKLIENDELLNK